MNELSNVSEPLRDALRTVLMELVEVEREFGALARRLTQLRETSSGLQGLLGARAAQEVAAGVGVDLEPTRPRGSAGSRAARDRFTEGSSTARVVELLRAGSVALTRQAIIEEFFERDWVDPGWKEPEAAIRMAIRRAVERGAVWEHDGRFAVQVAGCRPAPGRRDPSTGPAAGSISPLRGRPGP